MSQERIRWVAVIPTTPVEFRKPRANSHPRLPITQLARAIKPYGFVYVFGARELVKIGMSLHDIYRRWHSIKTANPWLERPLYVTAALYGRVVMVEKASHRALREYRVTGEWFNCERPLAIETVQRMVKEHDNGP